jgi:hypothetical protein
VLLPAVLCTSASICCVHLLLVSSHHHLYSPVLLMVFACLVSAPQVCLLNYRKDGSTFLNQFFLSPIKVCVQQQAATDGQPVCLCCTCAHGAPLDVAWKSTTATLAVTAAMHYNQLQY